MGSEGAWAFWAAVVGGMALIGAAIVQAGAGAGRLKRLERLAALHSAVKGSRAEVDVEVVLQRAAEELRERSDSQAAATGRRFLLPVAFIAGGLLLVHLFTAFIWASDPPLSYWALGIAIVLFGATFVPLAVESIHEATDFFVRLYAKRRGAST